MPSSGLGIWFGLAATALWVMIVLIASGGGWRDEQLTWLALAAYNVGRGHFRDAQALARKLNKNPDKWADMKEVLPLLSDKKYYKDLRYGYARGSEPVLYVNRIRSYNELLYDHFGERIKEYVDEYDKNNNKGQP